MGPLSLRPLPGQFVAVRLRPSPDAPALMRSYSLSSRVKACLFDLGMVNFYQSFAC
jgi:ferredoxin-NADP reductase